MLITAGRHAPTCTEVWLIFVNWAKARSSRVRSRSVHARSARLHVRLFGEYVRRRSRTAGDGHPETEPEAVLSLRQS